MKVRKAIIPAAGLGTRVLPASKSVPKEMLNIVDKPAIQYLVEEAAAAGIEDILIITNRGKGVIEDHFDHSFELEKNLENKKEKEKILEQIKNIADIANIYFLRQKETKGLGHAILRGKTFVGDEPFAVLYGDDVIISEKPVTAQLVDVYNEYGCGCVGVKECSVENVMKYCTLDVSPLKDNIMKVHNIIEKPEREQILSCYSILGRVVLPPEVFKLLEDGITQVKPGEEFYLTDALAALGKKGQLNAVDFIGTRYDMGNKLGIMMANCEVALKHPEIGEDFKNYIKQLAASL